jgi:hypothetical protein
LPVGQFEEINPYLLLIFLICFGLLHPGLAFFIEEVARITAGNEVIAWRGDAITFCQTDAFFVEGFCVQDINNNVGVGKHPPSEADGPCHIRGYDGPSDVQKPLP